MYRSHNEMRIAAETVRPNLPPPSSPLTTILRKIKIKMAIREQTKNRATVKSRPLAGTSYSVGGS